MRSFRRVAFAVALLGSLPVVGLVQPPEEKPCNRALKRLFERRLTEPIADCGACLANVRKFIERMKKEGIPIGTAKTLYIRRRDGSAFVPSAARGGSVRWLYHAVLEVNGKIYDLDYTAKPVPTATKDYFQKMFRDVLKSDEELRRSGGARDSEIHVVAIPAADVILEGGLPKMPEDYGETPLVDYVRKLEKP